jgi:hypothetical protein
VLSSIATLPAGYTRQTILTTKPASVGAAYRAWGAALTTLASKIRPANDSGPILSTLGYWTDNGADYYYTYDTSKGYTGTLLAVRDEWQSKQIPMGYMQLDSWWYPKGPSDSWNHVDQGTYLYQADAELFPDGLAAFQQQLGKPLVTHGRWIDTSSPYHGRYQFSNNVVIDPAFWQSVMSYLRAGGVVVYEQDWLCNNAKTAENLTDADTYFDNMAHNATADGLDLQYCMALPRDYLQSTRYPNLTTIRVSDDRFERARWDVFLYDSQFAGALGIWPWTDVFMSGETTNLLLSNLSAGPVGVGDGLGKVNAANLAKVARPDGVIVKPDVPIVPTDATYVGEAAGNLPAMVATTSVAHVGLTYGYVFAYARQSIPPQQTYQAENATLSGAVVASDNAGYTGTGYADYQNTSNDYVQWTVQAATAGTYTLQFRYANGGTTNRPLSITANGSSTTLAFPPTGSWTAWNVVGLTVTLAKGSNTVRATDTGSSGGNIDWLGVSQGTVPVGLSQTASFSLATLGLSGPAYAYDYFAGTGTTVPRGGSVSATVSAGTYWIRWSPPKSWVGRPQSGPSAWADVAAAAEGAPEVGPIELAEEAGGAVFAPARAMMSGLIRPLSWVKGTNTVSSGPEPPRPQSWRPGSAMKSSPFGETPMLTANPTANVPFFGPKSVARSLAVSGGQPGSLSPPLCAPLMAVAMRCNPGVSSAAGVKISAVESTASVSPRTTTTWPPPPPRSSVA